MLPLQPAAPSSNSNHTAVSMSSTSSSSSAAAVASAFPVSSDQPAKTDLDAALSKFKGTLR
jgi:hypothetical protein